MQGMRTRPGAQFLVASLLSFVLTVLPAAPAFADVALPEGTTVYLETTKTMIGKKKETAVGDIVPARVWRDVVVDGRVVIAGGTPALAKVAEIKNRGIFGIKGKMSIAALETTTVDGQTVQLSGGYNKEGKGRVGVTVGVGLLLFWPALFVTGDSAKLPNGTVMDSFTMSSMYVAATERPQAPSIDLRALGPEFDVKVLYERLAEQKKPKHFEFLLNAEAGAPEQFSIDTINGLSVEPIPLTVTSTEVDETDERKQVYASVEIKVLMPALKQGFNTFEVAYRDGESRVSEEVLLKIEI